MRTFANRRILITGACGTVGRELVRQLLEREPRELIGIDNNESELFLLGEQYRDRPCLRFGLGDVRDRARLGDRLQGIDVVIHTAAYKHVLLCEQSPRDAIDNNILGVQNVIDAALAASVDRLLFTSSDKAVNPTNVMGTSKLMGERLISAAQAQQRGRRTILASTRFGNVLGSRGSVIPLFLRQIAGGGPITLTDPAMTRFIMTLEEAVRLVTDSVLLACGGEVFVTKMRSIRIEDLARVMIEEVAPRCGRRPDDIELKVIGPKPGEKLYEELLSDEEVRRTVELPEYFVVAPAFRSVYRDGDYSYPGADLRPAGRPYNSALEQPMEREELRAYLHDNRLLEPVTP